MNPFVFDLQYFKETAFSPIGNETYEAGSFILFVGEFNLDTGASTFLSASNFVLDGDSYKLVQTFTVAEKAYTLSLDYNTKYGFSCVFDYPHYLTIDPSVFNLLGGGLSDNGGGLSDNGGGFSVPDLDGNFGAYSNGSVVTVSGRIGEYVIEASQQLWAFPASEFQGSCVIYKLSQNGKILLAPHWMLTIVPKAS